MVAMSAGAIARYKLEQKLQEVWLDQVSDEDPASMAQRHVIEAEQHVADLRRILEELLRDRHAAQAELASRVLHTLEESLRLARDHLARERQTAAGTTN